MCLALYGTDILIGKTNSKQLIPSISKSFRIGAMNRDAFRCDRGQDWGGEWQYSTVGGREGLQRRWPRDLKEGTEAATKVGTGVPGCENSKCKGSNILAASQEQWGG